MKKKAFSDNKRSSKGFYAALGISAVMVGTACWFAYDQGNKLSQEFLAKNSISEPERAVDNKVTNVPKVTVTVPYNTTAVIQTATQPAYIEQPHSSGDTPTVVIPEAEMPVMEEITPIDVPNSLNTGITKLENVKLPLADVSEIIEPFSGGELVKSETTGSWQTHNGADIAAEVGSEVYAVSNGEIMSVEDDALWGVTVVLDHHNGFITKYCGLSQDVPVQPGDIVVSGNLIGTVGDTADIESALPAHLHIEITHHDRYIDPVQAFSGEQ
ncbi:MAG: M23 family metallopeptidase [Ruminococcus sp.]|nr:M23 family metallopeptidase [Ruminococcus sp.]